MYNPRQTSRLRQPINPRLPHDFNSNSNPNFHLQHHLHTPNTQPSHPPKWANDLLQKSQSNWTPQKTTPFPPKNYPNATVRFYLIVTSVSARHARKRTNNLQARIQVVPPSSPSKVLYSTSLGIPCTVLPAHIKVCRERILILRGWKGRARANRLQFSPVKMLRALLQSPH